MAYYLYVNYAIFQNHFISKIGTSNKPEKRIREFNLGIKYRFSFKNYPTFYRFFTVKVKYKNEAIKIENILLKKYKPYIMPFFGREVFSICPEKICLSINKRSQRGSNDKN